MTKASERGLAHGEPASRAPRFPRGALQAIRRDSLGIFRRYLQTLAFSLTISALLYFMDVLPYDRPYQVPLLYSLCIGTASWAIIDLGRYLLAPETGLPASLPSLALVAFGTVGGLLLGISVADAWFGWSSWRWSSPRMRIIFGISLMAGAAISYYFHSQGRSARLQGQMREVQRLADEAQLKLLETQLKPHMLFNTLANLRALIGTDPARAQRMLDHMIDYLRATLGASRTIWHPLSEEFARLADYLELVAIRMGPRLAHALELPPELASLPVPTLLLQPLVENSIRHGLEPKIEGGRISVRAWREGSRLTLEVADSGVGLGHTGPPPPQAPRGSGFGLAQVRERLAAAYGHKATLEAEGPPTGGLRVRVNLPYPWPPTDGAPPW